MAPILTPGASVGDWVTSRGTLTLVLKSEAAQEPDADKVYLLSASHVLAETWLDVSSCCRDCCLADPPSGDQVSKGLVRALDGDSGRGTDIGPIVKQTCLKSSGTNSCDAAVAEVTNPGQWDILSVPVDPQGHPRYLLTPNPDPDFLSNAVTNRGAVIRFGGVTGIQRGSISGDSGTHVVGSLTYDNLIPYRCGGDHEPGDSGSLITIIKSPDPDSDPLEIAPIGLHVGVAEDDVTTVFCPLAPVLGGGKWQIVYEP